MPLRGEKRLHDETPPASGKLRPHPALLLRIKSKTTVALAYADKLNLPYVRADAICASLDPTEPANTLVVASPELIEALAELWPYPILCTGLSATVFSSGIVMMK